MLPTPQVEALSELATSMRSCGNAFVAVAAAGVVLSIAASSGLEVEGGATVLLGGATVGDVAGWADSLLVAGLLHFAAGPFAAAAGDSQTNASSSGDAISAPDATRSLCFTFQGLGRLGLVFSQLSIAATTVAIVTTLQAASEWPPLVGLASGLFLAAALARSGAMW